MSASPSFIGIGAQRAGTGWLYRNLLKHPDVWLAPVKELHYFDRLDRSYSLADRLTNASWRRQCAARLLRDCFPGSRGTLRWDVRYFFGRRDDAWYKSLFEPAETQIAGEISPAYSTIDEHAVGRVRGIAPNAKILFLMRNPVDRVWSHAINRMVRREKQNFADIPEARFIELIDGRASEIRTDYLRTIRTWEKHFPPEQIYYGFYDDVTGRPTELLGEICTFIGVDPGKLRLDGTHGRQVKPRMGSRFEMPPAVRLHAAQKYVRDLEKLHERFGAPVERWLTSTQSIVRDADGSN